MTTEFPAPDPDRRRTLKGLTWLTAAVALNGCGGSASSATDSSSTPAPSPTPSPTPTPSPPSSPATPPSPVAGRLEAPPNDHYQYRAEGPSDWVDVAQLPAPVPWSVFMSATTRTLAPRANGALLESTAYDVLPVFGTMNIATWTTPMLDGTKIRQMYGALGDDIVLSVLPRLKNGTFPLRSGARGVGTWSAYCTWHGHVNNALKADGSVDPDNVTTNPFVPWWVGIVVDGSLCFAYRDGSISYPYKVPLESYSFDFTFYEPHRATQFVVDTGVGKVLAVERVDTRPVPTFSTTVFAEGFGVATSIRAIGQKLYVADNQGGKVWELDAQTKVRRKVCDLPNVWFLDSTSSGQLAAITQGMAVHFIDPSSGAVGPNISPYASTGLKQWVYLSVDKFGTCGPVDSVMICASHGAGNVDIYRFDKTGKVIRFLSGGNSKFFSGPNSWTWESAGHYPWVCEFHPSEGVMMFQGFANIVPNIMAVRNPARPAMYTLKIPDDINRANRGMQVIKDGGEPSARGVMPSFTCLMNPAGWSFLGCTVDHIANMDYASAAAFVRAGMIGSTPREIGSESMRDLLFVLYYNSQRHFREGAKLITNLLALPQI